MVCDPNGDNCTTVSDEDFWAERKKLKKTGNVYTGSGDFCESGEIRNAEGGVVATYVQISIDDLDKQYIFAIRQAVDPIPQATLDFFQGDPWYMKLMALLALGIIVLCAAIVPAGIAEIFFAGMVFTESGIEQRTKFLRKEFRPYSEIEAVEYRPETIFQPASLRITFSDLRTIKIFSGARQSQPRHFLVEGRQFGRFSVSSRSGSSGQWRVACESFPTRVTRAIAVHTTSAKLLRVRANHQ